MMKRFVKDEKGFTLIELIIVIAILAVIAAIAIPNIISAVEDSRISSDKTNARIIADAAGLVNTRNEKASLATGSYVDVTGLATKASPTDFEKSLFSELNEATIKPKYTESGNLTNFWLYCTSSGSIEVYVGGSSWGATPKYEVFPNPTPSSKYDR